MGETELGRHRQTLGRRGEELVAQWYEANGYRVVERNWRCRNGELDIILTRRHELVFCEVKTRSSRRFGHPVEAVGPVKQRRIRQLAVLWLESSGLRARNLRFDVAAVEQGNVEVWQAAF